MDYSEKETIHLKLGLLYKNKINDNSENIIHTVIHLNKAIRIIKDTEEKMELIKLNIEASRYLIFNFFFMNELIFNQIILEKQKIQFLILLH